MNIFNRNRNRAENSKIRKGDVLNGLVEEFKKEEDKNRGSDKSEKIEKKIRQNKFFTAREWFERSYHGETKDKLPKDVVERSTLEEIEALLKEFAYPAPKDEALSKDNQTDLFDKEE